MDVDRLQRLLGPRHPVAAGATVTAAGTTVASTGAAPDADFEIGSISKAVTGLLYADALDRGEVQPSTPLGELLPVGPRPVAAVTLDELATHRSGLPGLPRSADPFRRTVALWRRGTNPYGETLEQLLEQARTVALGRPRPRYSTFGFELLGHALAAAADTTFADLVSARLTDPLGLSGMYVPATPSELRPAALAGRSRTGRPREAWTGEALAPSGGLRATIADLGRLTAALLDGTAPGVAALEPAAAFGRQGRVGAGWVIIDNAGRDITWHNGGTGGFRSWLGLDREAGVGVVLLSATSASVDRHGFTLLGQTVQSVTMSNQ